MADAPSLDEILRGVAPECLDQPCEDNHLSEVALSLTDWQTMAPFLGLTEMDERAIVCRHQLDLVKQNIAMLRKWKSEFGVEATYRKLAEVLFKLRKCDIVEKLCHILLREAAACTGQQPPAITSYADYLQGRYQTEFPTSLTLQWPPPPTRRVFNLAMIRGQKVRYGMDEEMTKLMLQGRVRDVLDKQMPVKLEDIFRIDSAKRKVILIEGGPGSGKSTLAWHICQKWESGELFQEFKAVVFVELRDPAIQLARSVEDILQIENKGQVSRVVEEFQACKGQGLLLVMDGWDELPMCLHTESIFHRLIAFPQKENIRLSAVVITSRPIASGDLHHVVSSRVEILGFIPTDVKDYFTEVIGDVQAVQKLQDQLRERPVIEASCYVPLNAAIVAHLFLVQNQSLPTTLHGVFTSLVLCCLVRHARKEGKEFGDVSSLDNLPPYFQTPLKNICALAYHGVMKNKATFSAGDLEPLGLSQELATLGLIQGVESLALFKKSVSFSFLHLSVQELLAAFHISKLPPREQVEVFNTLLEESRFVAVFGYYAVFTKLETEGIREIIAEIVKKSSGKLQLQSLLYGLYVAQDPSLCQFVGSQLGDGGMFGPQPIRLLDLSHTALLPVDCLSVGYFLSCVCLTISGEVKARLHLCYLNDFDVRLLVEELSKCCSTDEVPGYVNLHLDYNRICGSGIRCIAELIGRTTVVRKLHLPYCTIRHDDDAIYGLRHLSQALKTNTSLVFLDIRHVGMTAEGLEVLAKALVFNEHLEKLLVGNLGDLSLDVMRRILSGRSKPLLLLDFL